MPVEKANLLAGSDPDYSIRDLYDAIEDGNFPSWTLSIQVMTPEQVDSCGFNPFDLTRIWPHSEFPLIPVGKMVLDRNPKNYFAEVEQIAFSPANMPPGIEASPDKMLQVSSAVVPKPGILGKLEVAGVMMLIELRYMILRIPK